MATESTPADTAPATLMGSEPADAADEKTDPSTEAAPPTEQKSDAPATKPAEKTEAAPPKEGEKADAKAADLELKLPEGVVPGPLMEAFKPMAKELGLDSPKAQKLVDMFVQAQQAEAKAQAQEVERQHKVWLDSLKSDAEFGGSAYDANVKAAQKAVHKYGDADFKALMNETGLGNHPALVRFAARIGRAIAEDSVAGTARAGGRAVDSQDELLRKVFPKMFETPAQG